MSLTLLQIFIQTPDHETKVMVDEITIDAENGVEEPPTQEDWIALPDSISATLLEDKGIEGQLSLYRVEKELIAEQDSE